MNEKENFEEYCLNEFLYEFVKSANQFFYKIVNDYIDAIYALFKNIDIYIELPSRLLKLADKKKFECEYHYQTILYILDTPIKKDVIKNNGDEEILRYYYHDVFETLDQMKWDYLYSLFENYRGAFENFDICECLTEDGKKELEKVAKLMKIEIDKKELQDEQMEENYKNSSRNNK